MNKTERTTDLNSRVVKIIKAHPPSTLNGGDKEYSFETVISTDEGFQEDNFSIRVIDEGLETEVADYVRKSPPPLASREGMLKARLEYLKSLGVLTFLDISKLGVPYAKFKLDGAIKYAVDLDGELIVEDGE